MLGVEYLPSGWSRVMVLPPGSGQTMQMVVVPVVEVVAEVELGQGEVVVDVGVVVVGGEDAFAVAQEGQAVAGVEG